jgi:hypothetical protein
MPRRASASRAGAVEGIRWFFSDERPKPRPPKPFWLTYTGDDVVTVPGVGLFQNGTTAEVDADVAARYGVTPGWAVQPRAIRKIDDDEDED